MGTLAVMGVTRYGFSTPSPRSCRNTQCRHTHPREGAVRNYEKQQHEKVRDTHRHTHDALRCFDQEAAGEGRDATGEEDDMECHLFPWCQHDRREFRHVKLFRVAHDGQDGDGRGARNDFCGRSISHPCARRAKLRVRKTVIVYQRPNSTHHRCQRRSSAPRSPQSHLQCPPQNKPAKGTALWDE